MQHRARRYRDIAAQVRAQAETMSDVPARQGMARAAEVWERLAALAEQTVPPAAGVLPVQPDPPRQD
jgi:hypothetical protein